MSECGIEIDLKKMLAESDWPENPWFLKDQFFESLCERFKMYPHVDIHRVTAQLQRLLNYKVCEKLMKKKHSPFVAELIVPGNMWWLLPKIFLGYDLEALEPWTDDTEIIKRLRNMDQYSGARLELEVYAALKRMKVDAEYYPPQKSKPSADLRVKFRTKLYWVELKIMNTGDVERIVAEFDERLGLPLVQYGYPDDGASVFINDDLNRMIYTEEGRKELCRDTQRSPHLSLEL